MKRDYLGNPFKDGDIIRIYSTTPRWYVSSYGWLVPAGTKPSIPYDLLIVESPFQDEEECWILERESAIREIDGALFEEIQYSGMGFIAPLSFLDRFISSRNDVVVTIKGISDSKEMYYANMHKRD